MIARSNGPLSTGTFVLPATLLNPNDRQMGSTFSGDVIVADPARIATLQQVDTDRGIDGRVSGPV
jgi:hypothetical protein